MIPLFFVYLFEYFINQALVSALENFELVFMIRRPFDLYVIK